MFGCEIKHIKLTGEQRIQQFVIFGTAEPMVKFFTWLELSAANGEQDEQCGEKGNGTATT